MNWSVEVKHSDYSLCKLVAQFIQGKPRMIAYHCAILSQSQVALNEDMEVTTWLLGSQNRAKQSGRSLASWMIQERRGSFVNSNTRLPLDLACKQSSPSTQDYCSNYTKGCVCTAQMKIRVLWQELPDKV